MSGSSQPHRLLYRPWNSPGQNNGVGSLSLLQGIFLAQGSNPGLRHCRRILYQLSHKGSPGIQEWVAYPFSSGSSWPRNRTGVSCIAGDQLLYQLSYQGNPLLFIHPICKSLHLLIPNSHYVASSKSPGVWGLAAAGGEDRRNKEIVMNACKWHYIYLMKQPWEIKKISCQLIRVTLEPITVARLFIIWEPDWKSIDGDCTFFSPYKSSQGKIGASNFPSWWFLVLRFKTDNNNNKTTCQTHPLSYDVNFVQERN